MELIHVRSSSVPRILEQVGERALRPRSGTVGEAKDSGTSDATRMKKRKYYWGEAGGNRKQAGADLSLLLPPACGALCSQAGRGPAQHHRAPSMVWESEPRDSSVTSH